MKAQAACKGNLTLKVRCQKYNTLPNKFCVNFSIVPISGNNIFCHKNLTSRECLVKLERVSHYKLDKN